MVKKEYVLVLRKIYDKAEKLLANRLLALIVLIAVLYCVLIGRVFVLQIVEGQSHRQDFTYKVQKTVKTSGTRGNIYDVNGKLLAYNKLVYTVNFKMIVHSRHLLSKMGHQRVMRRMK